VGNIGGSQYSQLAHGLKPDVLALSGDVAPRATLFIGAIDDLVVNIGDVGNKPYFETAICQVSAQDVVDQGGSAMA